MTHGWPGSIVEFLNVIGPLTNPTKHGGQPEDAFHVVLPRFLALAFPTNRPERAGAYRVRAGMVGADAALGLQLSGAGGDWGAGVTTWMAKQHVEGLAAIHLNLPIRFHLRSRANRTRAEKRPSLNWSRSMTKDRLLQIQSTRPQTIGYALADSPAGQAAWIYESSASTTATTTGAGNLARRNARQYLALLLTNTAASSARL